MNQYMNDFFHLQIILFIKRDKQSPLLNEGNDTSLLSVLGAKWNGKEIKYTFVAQNLHEIPCVKSITVFYHLSQIYDFVVFSVKDSC